MIKKNNFLLLILVGFILWIIYLFDSEMSRYGLYTIVSYNVHEMLQLIPLLSITITTLWLLSLIFKIRRENVFKQNILLFIFLIALSISQAIYIKNINQTQTTSFITDIDEINEEKMEIIIRTDHSELILDTPMMILGLLKSDGTEYGITYEWNKNNPKYGKVNIVQTLD